MMSLFQKGTENALPKLREVSRCLMLSHGVSWCLMGIVLGNLIEVAILHFDDIAPEGVDSCARDYLVHRRWNRGSCLYKI